MLYKKYLRQYVCLVKSYGIISLLFLPVAYIIIPVMNYLCYRHSGIDYELYNSIVTYTQLLLPLASIWFLLLILKEYTDAKGNEILYVTAPKTQIFLYISVILNLIAIAPLFIFYSFLFDGIIFEYLRVAAECILFCAITYFTLTVFSSVIAAIVIPLLYSLISQFRTADIQFLYYSTPEAASPEILKQHYLLMIIFSVILTIAAIVKNRIRKDYN